MPVEPDGQTKTVRDMNPAIMAAKLATGEITEQDIPQEFRQCYRRRSFTLTVESCDEADDT